MIGQKFVQMGSFVRSQPEELHTEILFPDPSDRREVHGECSRAIGQPESELDIASLEDDSVTFDGTAALGYVVGKPLADEGYPGKHDRTYERKAIAGPLEVEVRDHAVAGRHRAGWSGLV